jgi:prevent-host-death family protein
VYTSAIVDLMDSVTSSVSARELRADLSSIVGRVSFGHERIGVTRNGKLAAVVIGIDDLELLEQLEVANDLAAYTAARAADDGSRATLDDLRTRSAE